MEDALDAALGWRRTELLALEGAIRDAERRSPDSPLARALSRSGVALLYAHWEGFVKEACQCYVDFVAKRRLRMDELNDGLVRSVILALGRRAVAGDEASMGALIDAVRRPSQSRARIPKNTIVDTRSNLRFAVLSEIMMSIGLPIDSFITHDKLIDKSLCDGRNNIAHGRHVYPDVGDFELLHGRVVQMIEDVRDLILAAVRQQEYRRLASDA